MRKPLSAKLGLAFALMAGSAQAHVTVVDGTAKEGGSFAAYFRVTHSCGTSPTVALRVEIPEEVASARPQPKPGWTLQVETAPLAQPRRGQGGEAATRVSAVTWRGRLDPDQFDQFGVLVGLPKRTGPLYFPTVQTCESGEERWVEIPAPGTAWNSVKRPAPVITLTDQPSPAAPPEHDMSAMDHGAAGVHRETSPPPGRPRTKRGGAPQVSVLVTGGWIPTPPPGAVTAAGYFTIRNQGPAPERLVEATSPEARVSLHRSVTVDGVTQMPPIVGGLRLAPGQSAVFAPRGYHLMLMGMVRALRSGDRVPITLEFEGGRQVRTLLLVRDR